MEDFGDLGDWEDAPVGGEEQGMFDQLVDDDQ
jgi:hypothetical protein